MLLKNKIAVIYGAAGAIGGAVARAFAREGAVVHLAGRTLITLRSVEQDIRDSGGTALSHVIDALDPFAVERHLGSLPRIDISFNAIGIDDVQGIPLTEISTQDFTTPIVKAMNAHLVTASAAARRMKEKRSGVILALTANVARKPYINVGGFSAACAAIEALCRQLALELGAYNIRVVCLRSAGSPDAPGVDEVFRQHAEHAGITRKAFEKAFADRTMLKRLPALKEIGNAAALMASDHASAVTAAVVNLTCGELAD